MALRKLGVVAASALAFSAGTGGALAATHHGKHVSHAKLTAATTTGTTSTSTTSHPCPNMSGGSNG